MNIGLRQSIALGLMAALTSPSFAIGGAFTGDEVPSARAAGQGYVGVAGQNEDPVAVFTNPAAMTSLPGTQVTYGLHWENIHGGYQDNNGDETKEQVVNAYVPDFALTQSFMDGKISAGLATQSPYGLETNWPGNSPLRYVATISKLDMVDVTPAIAYKISPMLSVGAGADYDNVFSAQLDNHVNNDFINYALSTMGLGAPTSGTPDAVNTLRGTGAAWGYHAGFVFQPLPEHSIRVTYHSKINLRILGHDTLSGIDGPASNTVYGGDSYISSAYTDIVLPSNIQIGYAFKPTDKWQFEADAAWYHWSEAKDIDVRFPSGSLFAESVTPLNLRDAWSMATGLNFKANEKWEYRGGFWYEPWAAPDATFSPAFNDLSRYGLSVGAGYHFTANLTLDLAYSAVFMHNRDVQNSVGQNATGIPNGGIGAPLNIPSPDVSGTYQDFANLFAFNLTYRFGQK